MKHSIEIWKESAGMSWTHNDSSVVKTGYFPFEVTVEQKEYLESHISDIDTWCEKTIGVIPHTIKFEPFNNGIEDEFTCDCYFDQEEFEKLYNEKLDDIIYWYGLNADHKTVGNKEVSWEEPPTCPEWKLVNLLQLYSYKKDENDWFGNIAGDICKKLGENYNWFEYEDNVYFYDRTIWDNGDEGWYRK